ncbi:MAG: energy-coupling factor transporter transmembrane protein EcfT [Jiangellaceae bacterium]|nr:energy-coupling factor transporter transmembrane protein EcfT [Jiangellaceae bacterium]
MNTFQPGTSWLHRLPAGAKLAGVLVALAVTIALDSPVQVTAGCAGAVLLFASAGLLPAAPAQVWPMRWLLAALTAFQVLTAGWAAAVVVTGRIVVAVLLAGLVTLTTRVVELLEVFERVLRPLRRLGIDPGRVSLVLALAIRAVPVVAGFATEVHDAQRARGLRGSPRAYAVPLVVRSLRHADALGEALAARGLDDPVAVLE